MNKGIVALALVGLMASTCQAASAGARHQGKLMREHIRNAHASVLPAKNQTNQTTLYDESLSPPAGH